MSQFFVQMEERSIKGALEGHEGELDEPTLTLYKHKIYQYSKEYATESQSFFQMLWASISREAAFS